MEILCAEQFLSRGLHSGSGSDSPDTYSGIKYFANERSIAIRPTPASSARPNRTLPHFPFHLGCVSITAVTNVKPTAPPSLLKHLIEGHIVGPDGSSVTFLRTTLVVGGIDLGLSGTLEYKIRRSRDRSGFILSRRLRPGL